MKRYFIKYWKIILISILILIAIYWLRRKWYGPSVGYEQYSYFKKETEGTIPSKKEFRPKEAKKEIENHLAKKEIIYNAPFIGPLLRLFD